MEPLTIGALAKRSQVNLQTVRYYERTGLLPRPPRSRANYRMYPADTVRRIRFIKRAQELGFSLKEIEELLAFRVAPGRTQADVRQRAEAKIADVEEKIRSLRSMKKALRHLTAACCGNGSASACPILESLSLEKENR